MEKGSEMKKGNGVCCKRRKKRQQENGIERLEWELKLMVGKG